MAKETKIETEPYRMTAQQLFETSKSRSLIPLTLSADIGLGGGLPLGCTFLLGGRPKAGKSSCGLQYAANAQQLYGCKVFYANIEGRLDSKLLGQAKNLDLNKFEVIMGPPIYDKENKNEIIGHRKMAAQKWWSVIGETITNNPKSVIIVDSISSLSEEAELAEGMGYMSRGGSAKLESQFARQYLDLVVSSQITLILLAQVIANTSGYGEAMQIKCGNAIRHAADCIVYIKSVEKWKPDTSSNRILGQDMNWRIECSSLGPPFISTLVPLRFGKGIDIHLDVCRNAIAWNIIQAAGAWYYLPFKKDNLELTNDLADKDTLFKIQGEENLVRWLESNPEKFKIIDTEIRSKIFI